MIELLTTAQVAAIVGISPETVRGWCRRHGIASHRVLGHQRVYYPTAPVLAAIVGPHYAADRLHRFIRNPLNRA
ncbi:helix-turn-helix domain-containing protein [Micromonospora sp. SCSIO 07396]